MDDAIQEALQMNTEEQHKRMQSMTGAVESYTVEDWAEEQLNTLEKPSNE